MWLELTSSLAAFLNQKSFAHIFMTDLTTASQQRRCPRAYALMTAAYNEEAYIEKVIHAVLAQTQLPTMWIIVSDGSVDRTDEIVKSFARKHDFIAFLRNERMPGRSFGSKGRALRLGSTLLESIDTEFVGNLDADVSIGPSYFKDLMARFELDPKLGLAAGFVCDKNGDNYVSRTANRVHSIAHAAQLVRRECYDAIGGYAVLEHGGEDWHAQLSATMKGWKTQAFPELEILHNRPTGTADNLWRSRIREGRHDYSFGSDPIFELVKCLRRLPAKPFLIGAALRFAGFAWSYIRKDPRAVTPEMIAFLRHEQRERLVSFFHELWAR